MSKNNYIKTIKEREIVCLSQMTFKEGKEQELLEALSTLAKQTKKEEGCIAYEIWRDIGSSRSFVIYERFCNQKALEAHTNTPYVQSFIKKEYVSCVESHWDKVFDIASFLSL